MQGKGQGKHYVNNMSSQDMNTDDECVCFSQYPVEVWSSHSHYDGWDNRGNICAWATVWGCFPRIRVRVELTWSLWVGFLFYSWTCADSMELLLSLLQNSSVWWGHLSGTPDSVCGLKKIWWAADCKTEIHCFLKGCKMLSILFYSILFFCNNVYWVFRTHKIQVKYII